MSNTPSWLKGCKLVQFTEKSGIYTTYLKTGGQYIAVSYSDTRNGWRSHVEWFNSLNELLGTTCCSFSLEEITRHLRKKHLRTWIA